MALRGNQTLQLLRETCAGTGRLEWIGLRPGHRAMIEPVRSATLITGQGLEGDHSSQGNAGGKRQVTLIQSEHLPVIAGLCNLPSLDPALLRRNLVISGVNLQALKNALFMIGETILRGTGACHPCSRMEEALGCGGYNAVRGHGGITAAVIRGGRIDIGAMVELLDSG